MSERHVSINIFDLIDSICADFRREWKAGKRPRIEDYLPRVPENAREQLFRNLLPIDIRYRERSGATAQAAEYVGQFPQFKRVIGDRFNFSTSIEMQAIQSTPADDSAEIPAAIETPAANRIGDYELVRELGRGGFGVVYEAKHVTRRNRVALKTLPTGQNGQEINAERLHKFRREFRSLTEVNHPNLVGMQTLEVDGSQWFFTMDLIEGEDFLSYVRHGGKLDEGRLRDSLKQLVAGIVALHDQRILHRDLKPSNVLVGADGSVSILDFGLVAELEQATDQTASMQTQNFAGTPQYAAPEQVYGERSTATDGYALGTMLFEALTGEAPFRGTAAELLVRKQNEDAPALSGRADLPQDLAALVDGLLQRDPQNRPDSAAICNALGVVDETVSHDSAEISPSSASGHSEALLIGRESQLAELKSAHQELLKTQQPVVVFISGRSGEGKTALAEKFLTSLRHDRGALVLSGRCYDRESVPFKAIDSIVDAVVGFLGPCAADEVAQMLPRDIELLAHLFPTLGRVKAIADRATASAYRIDERQLRNRAFYALRELLLNMSHSKSMVLFIDDLQWGDGDSAEVLFKLLLPPHPPRLLLLGSFRTDEANESAFLKEWDKLAGQREKELQQRRVSVQPLTEAECLTLLAIRVGVEPTQLREQAGELFEDTRGNPYFLEQLIESFDTQTGRFNPVPLHAIIDLRLQRLPDDSPALLEVISIAGQAVLLEEVSHVAGYGDPAFATITHMRSERLVRLVGSQDARLVDTYHDKIRETVLKRMDDDRRRALHLKYAEWIEAQTPHLSAEPRDASNAIDERVFDLAHHFSEAADPRAFDYQFLAGEAALEAYAMDNALAHLRKAQQLQPEQLEKSTEYKLNFMLGKAFSGCGLLGEALGSFQESLACAENRFERAACYYAMGEIAWKRSEYSNAFENLRNGFAELGERLPRTILGKLAAGVFAVLTFHLIPAWAIVGLRRRTKEELDLLSQMYAKCTYMATQLDIYLVVWFVARGCVIAKQGKDIGVKCEAYSNYASILAISGASILAKPVMAKAEKLSNNLDNDLRRGHYDYYRGVFLYVLGRLDEADASLKSAAERLGRSGDYDERFARHFLWHVWASRGRASQIVHHAKREEEVARLSSDQLVLAYAWYGQAEGLAHQGKIEEATEMSDRAVAALESVNAVFQCIANAQKARVQIQTGDYRGARVSTWRAIKDIPKVRFFEITVPSFALFVEAVLAADWVNAPHTVARRDRKKAARSAFVGRLVGWLFPNHRPHAYRVSGRLAAANRTIRKAIRYFDKAIAAAKKTGTQYEHARALLDKSTLDYPHAASDRERGLDILEGLGCVLPDAEVEYLEIDREAHHARAAEARENESSDDQRESESVAPSHASG